MDRSLFSKKSPGSLVQIDIGQEKDWAFLPAPLPQSFEITQEIQQELVEAREGLAALDGMGRSMPYYELLLKPIQRNEAIKSSSLEGTTVAPEDLILYEIDPKDPSSKDDIRNERREVFNYYEALKHGKQLFEDIPISLRYIRELHRVLMQKVRGDEKNPGSFRRNQVQVGSDRRFIPPPPQNLANCLDQLEKDIHRENNIDKLIFCFMVHYQFEAIHPFSDGNGRVGRLLLSLMIYNIFEHKQPWLYLSPFFEKHKDEYISKLFNVSANNDWENWIKFCLKATKIQAQDSFKKLNNLVELRNKYIDQVSSSKGDIRINKLIDELFKIPVISVPAAAEILGVTYPTAQKDVALLEEQSIVAKMEKSKHPQMYMAEDILREIS